MVEKLHEDVLEIVSFLICEACPPLARSLTHVNISKELNLDLARTVPKAPVLGRVLELLCSPKMRGTKNSMLA